MKSYSKGFIFGGGGGAVRKLSILVAEILDIVFSTNKRKIDV